MLSGIIKVSVIIISLGLYFDLPTPQGLCFLALGWETKVSVKCKWLVRKYEGPQKGRRRKAKRFPARFLLPAFLCTQINFAKEMSGKEAVPQTLILLNTVKSSSNNYCFESHLDSVNFLLLFCFCSHRGANWGLRWNFGGSCGWGNWTPYESGTDMYRFGIR